MISTKKYFIPKGEPILMDIVSLISSYVEGLLEAEDRFIEHLDSFPELEKTVVELTNRRISIHKEMKAPAAITFQKLFSFLYTMGSTMPLGINIAAFPTTFQIISRILSYSNKCTNGIRFTRKGNTAAASRTRGCICPFTRALGKNTKGMMTARLIYISNKTASRFQSMFLCLIHMTILTNSHTAVKSSSDARKRYFQHLVSSIVTHLLLCVSYQRPLCFPTGFYVSGSPTAACSIFSYSS